VTEVFLGLSKKAISVGPASSVAEEEEAHVVLSDAGGEIAA
jgi:hypothetical protein